MFMFNNDLGAFNSLIREIPLFSCLIKNYFYAKFSIMMVRK